MAFDKAAATAAKSLQSCLTLCDPIDSSPPGSPIPGILQARTLEWVAISFSNAWKWKVKVKSLSRVRLLATPWTIAHQAPLSMGFSRQEYWSGVPLPSPWQIWKPPNEVKPYRLHIPLHYATILLLVTKSCLTLCNPMDYSPQVSSVPGISQARILEWVAIPFSWESSWPRVWTWVSCIADGFLTVWATREVYVMYTLPQLNFF